MVTCISYKYISIIICVGATVTYVTFMCDCSWEMKGSDLRLLLSCYFQKSLVTACRESNSPTCTSHHMYIFCCPSQKNYPSSLSYTPWTFATVQIKPSDLSPHNECGPATPIASKLTTTRMRGAECKVRKYGGRFFAVFLPY